MATAFVLSSSSCCCQNELNNWNVISDPQDISEIQGDPNYVSRGTLQCSALKQKKLNQKNKISGNIRGYVRESAKSGDGTKRNSGRGVGTNSQYSSLSEDCTCSSSGPFFTLEMYGALIGAYTFPEGQPQPYNVSFSLIVPNIVFLCAGGGTSMEIWSQYAFGSNVSEDPDNFFPVAGLTSRASIGLTVFGKLISITLPYNTWNPIWASDENFSGSYTASATIGLTREDC